MAKTFPTLPLRVSVPSNSYLSLVERYAPEGATQTFPAGAPLKASSGLLIEWVSVADADIIGFSMNAGQNTTGATCEYVMAEAIVELEANFLSSTATDNVLAAGDLWIARDLSKGTNLLGTGVAGWYFADAAVGGGITISEFKSDYVFPDVNDSTPAAGDTNARVKARVTPGVSVWY